MSAALAIVGGGFSLLSGFVEGIRDWKSSKDQQDALNAQADGMEALILQYDKLVKDHGMDLPTALKRISAHFDKIGGEMNTMFKEQMRLGTEQINSRLKSSLDSIQQGIGVAKTRAYRAERDYLEQEEDKLKIISKDFEKSNQELKNTAVQRRLGASGAMIAAVAGAQERYGEIQTQMAESKSRYFRGLGEQFSDVVKAGGFQTLQSQSQAGRESLGLQQQIGGAQSQANINLSNQEFGAGEGARSTAFDASANMLLMQQQADALRGGADAINPLSGLASGASGSLEGIGRDLFSAWLGKLK